MFILVVDNNRFYVSVLQAMLSRAGFNSVEYTDNGLECVSEIYKDENPDVIIIDEGQCYINGLDIVKIIRHSQPNTKIIIMTGVDSNFNTNLLPDNGSIYLMEKSSIAADNLPQILYNIFTEKISSTKLPTANKVFSSLRRSFTGMLNF